MQLFDAHCHLQDERLAGRLPEVLRRTERAGVRRMLCCGCHERNWDTVLALAQAHPEIVPSFGIHPWYMEGPALSVVEGRTDDWLETLERFLAGQPSGVGEIGLDHAVIPRADDEQEAVFIAQLRLARRLKRPVSLHCRKTWKRLLEILRAEGGVEWGGLIHSYSGSAELVRPLEEMGLYISFSGAITRPGNKRGHQALAMVSPERLLIETDSPDLPPAGAAGEVNEPANLVLVASGVAGILARSPDWVAEQTFANASRLFAKIINLRQ
ncbi:MAG: TatD family hydrolase [Kiritimatiellaeota bacterium]|nr:TatD family hydrolase [Kiritimatiellota bacterium]